MLMVFLLNPASFSSVEINKYMYINLSLLLFSECFQKNQTDYPVLLCEGKQSRPKTNFQTDTLVINQPEYG